MSKRTLLFSNPYHLHTRLEQLVVDNKETGEVRTMPVEDLGFVVLEHPQITFSQGIMRLFLEHNVAVIFCNEKYLPTGMLLNLDGHQLQTARFRAQLDATEPLKKNLWMQTVQYKVRNQAAVLTAQGRDGQALLQKARSVKSGDTSNEEAKAAAIYWPRLLGADFRRERFGDAPNALLNYGYAILRAATARAIAGSGLHPTLGIFHRNQYNSFCLADDLMEPYRPYVDTLVLDWLSQHGLTNEVTMEAKQHLLGVLTMDVRMENRLRPMLLALSETTASVAACMEGTRKLIKYPQLE
jgi:CRISPR-associated protein Cas1